MPPLLPGKPSSRGVKASLLGTLRFVLCGCWRLCRVRRVEQSSMNCLCQRQGNVELAMSMMLLSRMTILMQLRDRTICLGQLKLQMDLPVLLELDSLAIEKLLALSKPWRLWLTLQGLEFSSFGVLLGVCSLLTWFRLCDSFLIGNVVSFFAFVYEFGYVFSRIVQRWYNYFFHICSPKFNLGLYDVQLNINIVNNCS